MPARALAAQGLCCGGGQAGASPRSCFRCPRVCKASGMVFGHGGGGIILLSSSPKGGQASPLTPCNELCKSMGKRLGQIRGYSRICPLTMEPSAALSLHRPRETHPGDASWSCRSLSATTIHFLGNIQLSPLCMRFPMCARGFFFFIPVKINLSQRASREMLSRGSCRRRNMCFHQISCDAACAKSSQHRLKAASPNHQPWLVPGVSESFRKTKNK